jgi:cell division protein FtsQ
MRQLDIIEYQIVKMAKINKRISNKPKSPTRYLWVKKCIRFLRVLVVTVVGVAIVGGVGFYGVTVAQNFLNRPIANVIVKGNFHYVEKNTVDLLVQKMIGDSFVGENIDIIKKRLQAMSWIDNVNLARQWPDRLLVNVTEQTPIARWGDSSFINVRGELIDVVDNVELAHLSQLSGEKQDAPIIMQQYSVMATVFQAYGIGVSALEKDRRGVWQLRLDNGWLVVLGRGDIFAKVQRLTHLFDKQLLATTAKIKVIDIRYSNGLAVEWAPDENQKVDKQASFSEKVTMQDARHKRG